MACANVASLEATAQAQASSPTTLICTSITATSVEPALKEIDEAYQLGADAIELRLDFLEDLKLNDPALNPLLAKCKNHDRPAVVTFRPEWEGGQNKGSDIPRLAVLKYAAILGAPYAAVE